jgi:hypothetical protein
MTRILTEIRRCRVTAGPAPHAKSGDCSGAQLGQVRLGLRPEVKDRLYQGPFPQYAPELVRFRE